MQENHNLRDLLVYHEFVQHSIEKRKEFKENIRIMPYVLGFISIIIFILLSTPLHPKSLAISAFDLYSDAIKIESLTFFLTSLSMNLSPVLWIGSDGFILIISIWFASFFSTFPVLLPQILNIPSAILTELLILDRQESHAIREGKLNKALDKSRKNTSYLPIFIFLLPVIGLMITARADFSMGGLYVVMGFFVMFYFYAIFFSALIVYVLLAETKDFLFKNRFVDEYVTCLLSDCIRDVTDEERWRSIQSRRKIKSRLDIIADIFQEFIPNQAGIQDPITRRNFQLIASRFRALKQWLFIPKKDTRLMLKAELLFILEKYLDFDLDALIPEHEFESRKRLSIKSLSRMAFSLIRILSPILLVFLFLRIPIAPEGLLKDYLIIGVFIFTGFRVLLALDPSFAEALDSLLKLVNKAKDTIK